MTGRAISDAVQPVADHAARPHIRRLTHQHEKRGLKRILGVLLVPEHTAADAKHHWPVPAYEGGERVLVAPREIMLQELPVRGVRRVHDVAQPSQDTVHRPRRHGSSPWEMALSSIHWRMRPGLI